MAISEKTIINYFNLGGKKKPFYWSFAEYSRQNCHLQLVLYSLLLFLYEMTYPIFLHGFLPGKIKGFPMEVLIPGEGKKVYFWQVSTSNVMTFPMLYGDVGDFLVPHLQEATPPKLYP